MTMESLEWRKDAACRGLDPEIFHPTTEEGEEIAKSVCDYCPVRVDCLEYALETRQKLGVWGGATERERRRIIRRQARNARSIGGTALQDNA